MTLFKETNDRFDTKKTKKKFIKNISSIFDKDFFNEDDIEEDLEEIKELIIAFGLIVFGMIVFNLVKDTEMIKTIEKKFDNLKKELPALRGKTFEEISKKWDSKTLYIDTKEFKK